MGSASASSSEFLGWTLDALVWFHRWTGVAFCLLFALWFASGVVMVFTPFPSLSAADRTAHSAAFDPSAVRISPAEAQQIAGGGEAQRLVSVAGRTAYVVALPVWPQVVISADEGQPMKPISPVQAKAVAEAFSGDQAASVSGPFSSDQWTGNQKFDGFRPFYRVRMGGPGSVDLYVSSRTGEVVQRTRGVERFLNGPGALLHSLSIAPFRKNAAGWNFILRWLSFIGLVTAVVGYILGLFRTAQSALQEQGPSPFTDWLRWHHLLGVLGGLFVLTWIYSGWLSTDNGWLFHRASPSPAAAARFTGMSASDAAQQITLEELRRLGPSAQITFGAVGGQAFASATGGPQPAPRVVLAGTPGAPLSRVPDSLITSAVMMAWRGGRAGTVSPTPSTDFFATAERMPTSTVSLSSQSGVGPMIYVDSVDGRLVAAIDSSRALYTWLYYGLHTFRVPGLIGHPILRAIIILIPLLLGLAFSVTSVVIGVRRLMVEAPKAKRRRVFGVKVLQRSLDH
jgi:hypothetical protein